MCRVEGDEPWSVEQLRVPFPLLQDRLRDGRLITGMMPVKLPELRKHTDANGNSIVIPQQTGRQQCATFAPSPRHDHVTSTQEELIPARYVVGVEQDSGDNEIGLPGGKAFPNGPGSSGVSSGTRV